MAAMTELARVKGVCVVEPPENATERVEVLRKAIAGIDALKLLPCESKAAVLARKSALVKEAAGTTVAEASGCPLLDPSFFGWQNKLGWPVFALFSVDGDGDFIIKPGMTLAGTRWAHYAWAVKKLQAYQDKLNAPPRATDIIALSMARLFTREVSLKATFSGVMPNAVRERIAEKRSFFENVDLLAEIPDWKPDVVIVERDPLVLGYKSGNFFLIDHFDATPAEEYVRQEFGV